MFLLAEAADGAVRHGLQELDALTGPFDVAFDVGCFHCLDARGQQAYAVELHRLVTGTGCGANATERRHLTPAARPGGAGAIGEHLAE
ncbi:hypothetical protein JRI60_17065 [Archangium violaceum]|uniref:hypothetical protein n=1 Tax=Archangium violaceum TaxID=83451 RepID=UPI001951C564|nr:hypothetical protein [Archangium violaceum]QRO00617.1 hypothetical protein JRI60_17065 [Archangium violaceum]